MKKANYQNFVSVVSEEKPAMVFFHHKADEAQAHKIKTILKSIETELPLLPAYDYVVDSDENNQILAEYLGLDNTPIIIFYKAGSFHRYKDKNFTKKSILQFIGNKKLYSDDTTQEKASESNEEII